MAVRCISVFATFWSPTAPIEGLGLYYSAVRRLLWWPTPQHALQAVRTCSPTRGGQWMQSRAAVSLWQKLDYSFTLDNAGWTVTTCECQCWQVVHNSDLCLATHQSASVFFSFLRLLGSRQVVTQCLCHWTNCAKSCMSRIGSRKRAWTSTQSNMSKQGCQAGKKTSKNKKNTKPKQNQTTPQWWTCSARRAAYVPMNWEMNWILQQNKHSQPQQDRGEGAKTETDQQCRNPGSPQPDTSVSFRYWTAFFVLDVTQFLCLCTMFHELPQSIISLHVFGDDTVANVTVSKANLCERLRWVLPRSLLLRCFDLRRNANLLGDLRVACGLWWFCWFFVGVRFNDDLPSLTDHTYSSTRQLFTAYAIVRTEPSPTSATPEEKKAVVSLHAHALLCRATH